MYPSREIVCRVFPRPISSARIPSQQEFFGTFDLGLSCSRRIWWKVGLLFLDLAFLVELSHVERFVDDLGDGSDLCPQLLLNPVQGETIVVGYQIDGNSQVTESAGSSNSVQIRLRHLWKVEVDDNVDSLDVNSPREKVGAH